MAGQQPEFARDTAAGRFQILVDGVVAGFADYSDSAPAGSPGAVRTFPHTVVDPAYRGRGLAGKLIGNALDTTRQEGFAVRPSCPFVARFIETHPEYAELVA